MMRDELSNKLSTLGAWMFQSLHFEHYTSPLYHWIWTSSLERTHQTMGSTIHHCYHSIHMKIILLRKCTKQPSLVMDTDMIALWCVCIWCVCIHDMPRGIKVVSQEIVTITMHQGCKPLIFLTKICILLCIFFHNFPYTLNLKKEEWKYQWCQAITVQNLRSKLMYGLHWQSPHSPTKHIYW